MGKTKTSPKFWVSLVIFSLVGQIAWVMENMYFNVFLYNTISGDTAMIASMVSASAITATVTTLVMGALSDKLGRRKAFIVVGYLLWGVSVAAFAQWRRGPQGELNADTMVILGDSIPSGYGMHGDPGNAYTLGNQFTFGHGGFVQGTYPQLVADTLGVQNRYNYSRDAFRSVEIRRLIDPEYEAWLEQTENAQEHFISDAIMLIANVGGNDNGINLADHILGTIKHLGNVRRLRDMLCRLKSTG
mgnify:CR=1 FL=1